MSSTTSVGRVGPLAFALGAGAVIALSSAAVASADATSDTASSSTTSAGPSAASSAGSPSAGPSSSAESDAAADAGPTASTHRPDSPARSTATTRHAAARQAAQERRAELRERRAVAKAERAALRTKATTIHVEAPADTSGALGSGPTTDPVTPKPTAVLLGVVAGTREALTTPKADLPVTTSSATVNLRSAADTTKVAATANPVVTKVTSVLERIAKAVAERLAKAAKPATPPATGATTPKVYVVGLRGITELDMSANRLVATVKLLGSPTSIIVANDFSHIYVTKTLMGRVVAVDVKGVVAQFVQKIISDVLPPRVPTAPAPAGG